MILWGTIFFDYADDYLNKTCSNSSAESEAARFRDGEAEALFEKDPNNTKYMVFKVDGVSREPFFLYDNRTYFLKGCPDNRTDEEYFKLQGHPGDLCDANPYQQFNGLDVYPTLGWFGLYNHTWYHNEKHTIEFGYLGTECTTAKYVLTAKDVCGFKIFGVEFCPLLWIKHLFQFLLPRPHQI
jgi:hypothetical protein